MCGLPKGTPEPGESEVQTALREVREETGLEVESQGRIGSINYWFADSKQDVRFNKTVHFYLMLPTGGDLSLHDDEFDAVEQTVAAAHCADDWRVGQGQQFFVH